MGRGRGGGMGHGLTIDCFKERKDRGLVCGINIPCLWALLRMCSPEFPGTASRSGMAFSVVQTWPLGIFDPADACGVIKEASVR